MNFQEIIKKLRTKLVLSQPELAELLGYSFLALLLVTPNNRDYIFWIFFGIVIYLLVSSYVLMWLRKNPLNEEKKVISITLYFVVKLHFLNCQPLFQFHLKFA